MEGRRVRRRRAAPPRGGRLWAASAALRLLAPSEVVGHPWGPGPPAGRNPQPRRERIVCEAFCGPSWPPVLGAMPPCVPSAAGPFPWRPPELPGRERGSKWGAALLPCGRDPSGSSELPAVLGPSAGNVQRRLCLKARGLINACDKKKYLALLGVTSTRLSITNRRCVTTSL